MCKIEFLDMIISSFECYLYSQVGSEVLQKFYSSGIKFLTMFPDGSAQVLYPLRFDQIDHETLQK